MGPPEALTTVLGCGVTVEEALDVMLGPGPSANRSQPHLQVPAPGASWCLQPHGDRQLHGGPKAEGAKLEAVAQQGTIAAEVVRCCQLAQQERQAQLDFPLRQTKSLQEVFGAHVMCDYTPTHPKHLTMSKWASLKCLANRLEQHAPAEVKQLGLSGVKQMITAWHTDHPAFAGLPFSAWCKKLKDNSPQAHHRDQVIKFSFEYTPRVTVDIDIWN